jgi:AcrR family transcriptional regulator
MKDESGGAGDGAGDEAGKEAGPSGSTGSGLPVGVEAAWGLRLRPAKGPKPGLDLDRIVTAAVGLAQADGLAAVSMSKVAAAVDVTAMALYRYVSNKDELLALMVDAGLGAPPEVPSGQGWRAGLTQWAWAETAAYRRHPWALRVPIAGLPALPNQVAWMDHGLQCLAGTGISEDAKLSTILLISNLVRGYGAMEQDLAVAFRAADGDADEMMASFGRTVSLFADPERFPALSEALASGALNQADPPEQEFVFGLERVLDGIDVLITAAIEGR